MGLITNNMIYVCIGASPCPVIVDLVIIGDDFPCPGSHPAKGQPTLRLAPPPLLVTRLVVGSSPLRAPCSLPYLRVPRCKLVSHGRLPPLCAATTASDAGLPCGLALAAAGRPLTGALTVA
ncbi:hypothetical protein B296_00000487 [Ensete ventricosum]|uniref:Uncharacterized protein n=1 Tax=Ensete ventricosum TaxID=4639 RepID=A0A426YGS3_ENSVE|nr:hypothetical protein B296_00000487 [Ensete ventricosum]